MPLLDSALAFAITMLALSLACSAILEMIHRIFKMRQAGFKYMLEQMFDQVLSKYLIPTIEAKASAALDDDQKKKWIADQLKRAKTAFVERMRANRVPMGVPPNATPEDSPTEVARNKLMRLGVWGGRELTELSPVGFMERLGTMDIGTAIANAAPAAGQDAADYLDAALKDIAQKFEALGKDAQDYFEGRARLISVVVAVVFAFVVHADAIDLYTTFLQNPNATAAVIAKSNAIQAQYAAQQGSSASDEAKKPAQHPQQAGAGKPTEDTKKPVAQDDVKKPAEDTQKAVTHDDVKKPTEDTQKTVTQDDGKKQFEDAQKAAKAARDQTEKTVKEFADLGVPLGWTSERYKAANLLVLLWSCKELPDGSSLPWWTVLRTCKSDEPKPATTAMDGQETPAATAARDGTTANAANTAEDLKYTNVWFGIPRNLGVFFYLLLGGLLIGLGAPFWFNVVTTITNIRGGAGGGGGAGGAGGGGGAAPGPAAPQAPGILALRVAPETDKPHPATPAGAFQIARAAAPVPAAPAPAPRPAPAPAPPDGDPGAAPGLPGDRK